jgi:hypothetical protein
MADQDSQDREAGMMRALIAFVLLALGSAPVAADTPMPWAFVNGPAKGYSIKLESASPTPGTAITVGQRVEFKVTVSYQLSIADSGSIILVVQDENNKNLLADQKQPSQSVGKGKGTVTLAQSFIVPSGSNEIRLFVPLTKGVR